MTFSLSRHGKIRLKGNGRFASAHFPRITTSDPIKRAEERKRRRMYTNHRKRAKYYGIKFLLSYKEWLKIWLDSGHWHERGRCRGQYCMARFGDKGPYAVGNVRICTVRENHLEYESRPEVKAARARLLKEKQGEYWKGRKHKASSRRKMREAKKAGKQARALNAAAIP